MFRIRFISAVSVLCLLTTVSGFSQSLTLVENQECHVRGRMSHLRDNSDSLTFSDIRQQHFTPITDPAKAPSFGFDRATHWFKFSVTNTSNEEDWLMEIPYAPLDRVDFYLEPDSGAVWSHKMNGDTFPIAQRELPHRHIIFKFSILPEQTKTVYLRVKTISSVQLPVIISSPETFQLASYHTQIINGFFYGAMFVMILYQLFLFVSIRDRTTFYYVLTLVSMANVIAFFQGYTFLFVYSGYPALNNVFAALSGPFFVLCSALLTRSFLNIRQFSKVLDNLLLANTTLNVVVGILILITDELISYKYHHLFVLVHCLIVLTSAAYCLYRKYRPALYYLLAWATLLLAAVAFTMGNLGLAPGYLGTNYQGLMIGCVLQVLLISFALGERWNILVKENQAAKELELRRGQEENERLEREVKLRTEEIRKQNEKLGELNRIKDKLFSVVSHDIKAPLTSLKLSLALTKIGNISPEEFKTLSNEIENHLEKTTDFLQNLLQWAKFQLRGESVRPVRLDLCSLINESLLLLESDLRQKVITVKKEIYPETFVFADPVMIQSVIRNLLTNALKFTPLCGMIVIKEKVSDSEIVISVTDTGDGIPESRQDKIFTLESLTTPGTQQESGTGLGLVLCKEFVEKNKGRIWFETEEGKGTTFYFALPVFKEKFSYA